MPRLASRTLVTLACVALAASTAVASPSISPFFTIAPVAAIEMGGDGHGVSEKGIVELGAGGDVVWRIGEYIGIGVGARYDLGRGERDTGHFLAIPAVVRVGSKTRLGELSLAVGVGPAAGRIGGFTTVGASGEVALGYRWWLAKSRAAFVTVGVRIDAQHETGGEDMWLNEYGRELFHGQLGYMRFGVTYE